MSDSRVRAFLREMERFAKNPTQGGVMSIPVRDVAENLRRAVDAPDAPQIIHTVEELEGLESPAWLMLRDGFPVAAGQLLRSIREYGPRFYLPAVVIVPTAQIRAARKALEEA